MSKGDEGAKPGIHERFQLAIAPVDEAFRASEAKWGVGRLERLVSVETLRRYRDRWRTYRAAIQNMDVDTLEEIGPRMIRALAHMEREAAEAGHKPLHVECWEAPMADGSVLVVTRTLAEAASIARDQSDTRAKAIWSLAELARVLPLLSPLDEIKKAFPGASVTGDGLVESGVQQTEMAVKDWAEGDELVEVIG